MTSSRIADIIYKDCTSFGVAVVRDGNIPEGRLTKERIVVHPKRISRDRYWCKCFIEVNWLVPDIGDNADLIRLAEVEEVMMNTLKNSGYSGGERWLYETDTTEMMEASELKAHFINCRLLFKTINTLK